MRKDLPNPILNFNMGILPIYMVLIGDMCSAESKWCSEHVKYL